MVIREPVGVAGINRVGRVRKGGYKQSGRGRLRGLAALDDFLEYKHIVMSPGRVPVMLGGPAAYSRTRTK